MVIETILEIEFIFIRLQKGYMTMPRDSKKIKILDSATKIFAVKGFQYATMAEIAEGAGISTGLTYSYFKNKLDVLLSIIIDFLQRINQRNAAQLNTLENPLDKIYAVFHNFENLVIRDENDYHLVKVLNEGLPHLAMISEPDLQEKRRKIIEENRTLINTVDKIITEGQKKGVFDSSLSPSVMRQILCGSIERVIYGLFFSTFSGEDIGYNREDANKAVERLIKTFINK